MVNCTIPSAARTVICVLVEIVFYEQFKVAHDFGDLMLRLTHEVGLESMGRPFCMTCTAKLLTH
eukprot:4714301-Amphidinium_carterae.1